MASPIAVSSPVCTVNDIAAHPAILLMKGDSVGLFQGNETRGWKLEHVQFSRMERAERIDD